MSDKMAEELAGVILATWNVPNISEKSEMTLIWLINQAFAKVRAETLEEAAALFVKDGWEYPAILALKEKKS